MNRNENFYLVFELPFDPPVMDRNQIEKAIKDKEDLWSRQGDNDSLNWLNRNRDSIVAALLAAGAERQQMQAEAGRIFQQVKQELSDARQRNILNAAKRREIANRYRLSLALIKNIESQGEAKVDLLKKYYELPAGINLGEKNVLQKLQKILGNDSIYTYLGLPETATKDEVKRCCQEKRNELKNSRNSEQQKERETYKDIDIIADYAYGVRSLDIYRAYKNRKSLLDELGRQAGSAGSQVNETMFRQAEQDLSAWMDNGSEARALVLDFCAWKKLDVQCVPCFACQELNYQSATTCQGCGAPLVGMEKVSKLYRQTEDAILCLQFSQAEVYWRQAEKLWPKNQRGQDLLQRLQQQKAELEPLHKQLQKAMRERCYCEARTLYQQLQKKAQGYRNDSYAAEINDSYAEALGMLEQAKALDKAPHTDENISRQAEACAEALRICADLPDVARWLPQPKAVTGLQVICDAEKCRNFVSWQPLADEKACQYILVRGESPVENITDGKQLCCGTELSYEDKGIRSRRVYYYNVFVRRGEKYSAGVNTAAAKRGYKNAYALPFAGNVGNAWRVSDSHIANGAAVELELSGEVPPSMDGYLLVYDCKDYPQARCEDRSKEKFISLAAYENTGKLWLDDLPDEEVYISVFAAYNWDVYDNGENADLSKPQRVKLAAGSQREVRFELKAEKTGLLSFIGIGKVGKINLTFYNEAHAPFALPKLTIVCKHGSPPYRSNDGRVMQIIPQQSEENAIWSKEITVDEDDDEMYIGVFQMNGQPLKSVSGIYKIQ